MKAIYPGTFHPFHEGHLDIYQKAKKIFDYVTCVRMINPDKEFGFPVDKLHIHLPEDHYIEWKNWNGLLVNYVEQEKPDVIIRGLRNGHDLQYEMNNQYWNEDLGLKIPIVYFVCDRKFSHISSSAIRSLERFK